MDIFRAEFADLADIDMRPHVVPLVKNLVNLWRRAAFTLNTAWTVLCFYRTYGTNMVRKGFLGILQSVPYGFPRDS